MRFHDCFFRPQHDRAYLATEYSISEMDRQSQLLTQAIIEPLWMKWSARSIDKTVNTIFFDLAGAVTTERQLPTFALLGDFEVEPPCSHDLIRCDVSEFTPQLQRMGIGMPWT